MLCLMISLISKSLLLLIAKELREPLVRLGLALVAWGPPGLPGVLDVVVVVAITCYKYDGVNPFINQDIATTSSG